MSLFFCIARKSAQKDQFIYDVEKGVAVPSGAESAEKQGSVNASKAAESTKQEGVDVVGARQEKLAQMEELESAGREAAENVNKAEVLEGEGKASESTGFPEAEKLQAEVIGFNKRTEELHKEGREISSSVANFQKAYQRFEAGKKEWSVFLRGSPFVDDEETEQLNHQLQVLRRGLAQKMHALRVKQHQLEEEGKDLVEQGQELRKQKEEEKNKRLSEVDAQGTEIDKTKKKNKAQYSALEAQQKKLYGQREQLKNYRNGLEQQSDAANRSGEELKVKEEQVQEFQKNLDESVKILDEALAKNPSSPQKEELLAKREELLKHKQEATGGIKEIVGAKEKTEGAKTEINKQLDVTAESEMDVNFYLNNKINPSLSTLDRAVQDLEVAKLKNGTQKEQIEAHYMEILAAVDEMNMGIVGNVASNTVANKELIGALDQQASFLNAINIERPDVWDASVSLLFNKIGEGATLLTRELICQSILDPISRYIKRTTKNIPVINVLAQVAANIIIDLPSGVIEGVGELVSGISAMIASPLQALKGIAALAGRNPQTGKWSFSQMGDTWSELGKVLIAYENFKKSQWGKGVGKVALNVLLTATGAGAAAKGAQGAAIAYGVARVAGSGVAKAGLKAAGTGASIFVGEAASGLSKLPGNVLSGAGKLLKVPVKLAERLRLDKTARLGKQLARTEKELGKVENALNSMVKEGKVPESCLGKTAQELEKLSPAELVQTGIKTPKQILDFLKYKEVVKTSERLTASLSNVKGMLFYTKISPELTKLPSLRGKKLDRFIEKFNKNHPDGVEAGSKYQCLYAYDDGMVVALDETGKLKKFESVQKFAKEAGAFKEKIFMQKVENMAAVVERFRAIPAEELKKLSVDEIYVRVTEGVSLSEGQARLVRSKIEVFKENVRTADYVAGMDHEAQVAMVDRIFKQQLGIDPFDPNVGLMIPPERIKVIAGEGGMPSSIVIVVENDDYLRLLAEEKKPWRALAEEEQTAIINSHGRSEGLALDVGGGNIVVIPRSVALSGGWGKVSVIAHEVEHGVNKLFGIRAQYFGYGEQAARAFASGHFEQYIQLRLAQQLNWVRDEVIAFLTNSINRNNPRGMYERFTKGHYSWDINEGYGGIQRLVQEGKINLDRSALNRIKQTDHALRKQYGDIVDAGLGAAEEILKHPQGYEMMRLTPIEHWPRMLEYLRNRPA